MDLRLFFALTIFGFTTTIFRETASGAPPMCDAENSQVSIRFLFAGKSQWTHALKAQLRISVAYSVNSFCYANASHCGLKNTRFDSSESDSSSSISTLSRKKTDTSLFTSSDVVIVTGYPKEVDSVHSLVLLYVKIPDGKFQNEGCSFLRKPILKELITLDRDQLHSDLKVAAGKSLLHDWMFRVSHVDDTRVLPPSTSAANSVAVPVICTITLLLALAVLFLECRRRIQHREVVERSIQQRQAAKDSPLPNDESFSVVDEQTKNNSDRISPT